MVNVLRSLKNGKRAGNDPWKGNTLEWFTQSPPPANNFDVIPRVRSVEPMKDIRREVAAVRDARPERVAAAGSLRHVKRLGARHASSPPSP